ncbi:MAG: pyridoxamine 5'-phosphate oxidase family protein [Ferruginibacter sp.]
MDEIKNLSGTEAIKKIKELTNEINICLFCTDIQNHKGATARPMATQQSERDNYLWFISDRNSDKNKEVISDNKVQLFYSDSNKSSFITINGIASVVNDKNKIEELWEPLFKTWFQGGKDDPNISLIKVEPIEGAYWDSKGNRAMNFIKMIASVVAGKDLVDSEEGSLKL